MTITGQIEFRNILLVHSGPANSAPSRIRHPLDSIIEVEARILEDFGHQVTRLAVAGQPETSVHSTHAPEPKWENRERENFTELMKLDLFHLIHFHLTKPLHHPGIYEAALSSGKAVVQTLHFPMDHSASSNASADPPGHADDKPEAANQNVPRNDAHRHVDMFILPTAAFRPSLINAGVAPDRIGHKPYALPADPGVGNGRAGYALYVGPIDAESGVDRMLASFMQSASRVPLKIVGAGPLQSECVQASRKSPHIQFLGTQSRPRVIELLKDASLLIMPVPSFANFTLLEAMATGLPVLAIDSPDASHIIEPHLTGVLCEPDQLALKAASLIADKTALAALRRSARSHFLANHTPRKSHDVLIDLYHRAGANQRNRR